MIQKIISGGQTGADQAVLDVAIMLDIPHGGWIPRGRKTEAGILPAKYKLKEIATPSYPARTEKNVIDSMATNIVGTGLVPQASPKWKLFGWDEDTAKQIKDQQELAFSLWARHCADTRGRMQFWMMQLVTIYSLLNFGEYFRQPIMISDGNRLFSLALQSIHPLRVRSPEDKKNKKRTRDGIRMSRLGAPESYWVANPDGSNTFANLPSSKYSRVPARVAHGN